MPDSSLPETVDPKPEKPALSANLTPEQMRALLAQSSKGSGQDLHRSAETARKVLLRVVLPVLVLIVGIGIALWRVAEIPARITVLNQSGEAIPNVVLASGGHEEVLGDLEAGDVHIIRLPPSPLLEVRYGGGPGRTSHVDQFHAVARPGRAIDIVFESDGHAHIGE